MNHKLSYLETNIIKDLTLYRQDGDIYVLEKLINECMWYVHEFMGHISSEQLSLNDFISPEDLLSEGKYAIMKFINKYQVEGRLFLAAIRRYINHYLTNYINECHTYISASNKDAKKALEIQEHLTNYYTQHGYYPNNEEVIKEFNLNLNSFIKYRQIFNDYLSLSSFVPGESYKYIDEVGNEMNTEYDSIFLESVPKEIIEEEIRNILGTLNNRERMIIELRFGFTDGTNYTLESVGKKFNVTKERIRQIEGKALRKLWTPSQKKFWDYYKK